MDAFWRDDDDDDDDDDEFLLVCLYSCLIADQNKQGLE